MIKLHDDPSDEPPNPRYVRDVKHYRVANTMYTMCGLAVHDMTRVTNIDNVTCKRCIALIGIREIRIAKWKEIKP